jgi:hypothetical protein
MSIAKSLRKANYLSGLSGGLTEIGMILEEERKKKEQAKFFNTVTTLYKKWKEGQEKASRPFKLKEGGEVNNIFSPNIVRPGDRMGRFTGGIGGELNVPDLPPEVPETQTQPIPQSEKYSKASENLDEFMQAIAPSVLNPNIGEGELSRVNVLSELAKQQTERLRPKDPTYFNLSQGEERYQQDEKGIKKVAFNPKLSTSNIEEYERDEKGNYKVYTIEGQKYYNKLKKDAQGNQVGEELTRIPKSGEGGTTINLPENPPDISQQEKDLTKSWDNYEYYNKITKELSTELAKIQEEYKTAADEVQAKIKIRANEIREQIKTADEQKSIWYTDVKGTTNQLANKLNSKMPGFEKIYNLLFQSPEVKSRNAKKIDDMVDREMEGASDDAKRWMKRILKVRAFE